MTYLNGFNRLANLDDFSASAPGRALQEQPLGFIDIGARGGAHALVEPLAKFTAVLGFEPDLAEYERLLQDPAVYSPWAKFLLKPIALGAEQGEAALHLLSASTNHSLLPPNEAFTARYQMDKWSCVGQTQLTTDTLDNVLNCETLQTCHWGEFIKLDTQGTEYEILQGSLQLLAERTVAIVTEVAFCELYKKQRLFSDVEALLRAHGFSFYGFTTLYTRSKKFLNKKTQVTRERVIYSDAIFFKDPLPGGYVTTFTERKTYALFTVALLLGYFDFALELATNTWLKDADILENNRITNLIKTLSAFPVDKNTTELNNLVKLVNSEPTLTNVAIGRFVDTRRQLCDYYDV
jgi:FkbM family methyltransferase